MNKCLAWVPNLDSWMSAFLLLILYKGIEKAIIKFLNISNEFLSSLSTEHNLILAFLIFLSPILVITIVHHLIYAFLDIFSPASKNQEMRKNRDAFPGLISWWEGFFGWQALVFALLVSTLLELIFFYHSLSFLELSYWWNTADTFFTRIMFIRLIILAFVYQFEATVRKYLIALGTKD